MLTTPLLALALGPAQQWALPPIEYGSRPATDRVAELSVAIESGDFAWTERIDESSTEPLSIASILIALDVPATSQTTVFSRTSMQARKITPRRPRALYFSDDVYVGYVPDGDLIEITALDKREGLVFYTIDRTAAVPAPKRETNRCLQCHAPSRSGEMPAHVLRSLHPMRNGEPRFASGSIFVDETTPYELRWGGWYVTGEVGDMKHRGNLMLKGAETEIRPSNAAHATLEELCDVSLYPVATSDIVALLVLEHQAHAHNVIVGAGYEARRALDYQRVLNEALGEPEDTLVDSTESRLDRAARSVVDALLHVGEPELPSPVGGDSPFRATFEARGRRDEKGRSLRDLDLRTRLFKYPLSYTIDSEPFRNLPAPLLDRIWRRLGDVLHETSDDPDAPKLSVEDRSAVLEILNGTRADEIPEGW